MSRSYCAVVRPCDRGKARVKVQLLLVHGFLPFLRAQIDLLESSQGSKLYSDLAGEYRRGQRSLNGHGLCPAHDGL